MFGLVKPKGSFHAGVQAEKKESVERQRSTKSIKLNSKYSEAGRSGGVGSVVPPNVCHFPQTRRVLT